MSTGLGLGLGLGALVGTWHGIAEKWITYISLSGLAVAADNNGDLVLQQ